MVGRYNSLFALDDTLLRMPEQVEQLKMCIRDREYEDRLNELAKQYNYENTDDIVSLYSEEMIREEIVQEKVISLIEENAVQPE